MDIVYMLMAFGFTMAEYLCLLWSLKIGVKRHYVAGIGALVLIAFWAFLGEKIGSGGEGYCGIRIAFASIIFMIDKKKLLDKIQGAFLVALMKDCLLLAVETWFVESLKDFSKNHLITFGYFAMELMMVALLGIILRVVIKSLNKEKLMKVGSFLDYVILIGCFDIFTCLWWAYYEIMKGRYTLLSDRIYTSFGAVSLILLEITILYKKWMAEQIEVYAKSERELHEAQKNYYRSLLDKEIETKKYRHDMNNHMICIKSLMEEKNYEALQDYIDELYDNTNALVNKDYKTGNSIIDALTNHYAKSMDEGIRFELTGSIYKSLDIDDIALSSIYSNMLSNAVEAQKKLAPGQDKYINVALKQGEKFAQIIVCNSMEEEAIADPGTIKASKADKENHGFGFNNIRKNVAESKGKTVIEAEDHEFCVKVILPICI